MFLKVVFILNTLCLFSAVYSLSNWNNLLTINNERETYAKYMLSYIDTSVNPCDDFYQYACGNYFKTHKRPGEKSLSAIHIIGYEMENTFNNLLMEPVEKVLDDISAADKARLFYQSCMKENIFNYQKSETYLNIINNLGGWPVLNKNWKSDNFNWFNVTIAAKELGFDIFLSSSSICYSNEIETDFDIGKFTPDLLNKQYSRKYQLYKSIFKKLMMIYGATEKEATKAFKEIVSLMTKWRKLYVETETIDLYESLGIVGSLLEVVFYEFNYKPTQNTELTIDELAAAVPEIDFKTYFKIESSTCFENTTKIKITTPKYFKKLNELFTDKKNIRAVANYAFLKIIHRLHDEIKMSRYQRTYCIDKLNNLMEEVVSAIYLNSKYYDPAIEDELLVLCSYIKNAFKDIIKSADWLDKETKKEALIKLQAMKFVVGDSEFTLDFENMNNHYKLLNITHENNFYENNLEAIKYETSLYSDIIPRGNYSKHEMYSSVVNAWYLAEENKFILQAGIFRKPFYYSELPKSYNFGAIGTIIGHEMTHGFDNTGKDYDKDGNQKNWWSNDSKNAFEEKANCFINQYNSYWIDYADKNIDGEKTLSENIADAGGIREGYIAYQKWLKTNLGSVAEERETLPGLNMTNEQLFFLSFAQLYCSRIWGQEEINALKRDPHSVPKWRVIGTVSNLEEFAKAFNCPEESKMNPKNKCTMW